MMFFEEVGQIREIAMKAGTSVFVLPREVSVEVKGAITLAPEEKTVITIEQVREVLGGLGLKQTEERFVIIRPAEKLGVDAANALLKNLEEPGEKVHYILITEEPSLLLPTILSRAVIYVLRRDTASLEIIAEEEKKALAKKLITAGPGDLVSLAEEIAKKKNGVREYALEILGLSVEILTKSYYITGKEAFLKKIPKFLQAYENVARNGHIKLQIVGGLI